MDKDLTLGFLGSGKMATALAEGFLQAGLIKSGDLYASDVYESALNTFTEKTGARPARTNVEVVSNARVLVLAVKPGQIVGLLEEIRNDIEPQHLIVSIAAGVRISALEKGLPPKTAVIRVMPNTPALVGASASAYAVNPFVDPEMATIVERLFSSVGVAAKVDEVLLDAITGLSGSGPAYVYQFIEALSDGGVAAGLPRDIATRFAAQTVYGAAKMVLETGMHPGTLKDMVTSPGGTTIEGIQALEEGAMRATVMRAVRRATEKSQHLANL